MKIIGWYFDKPGYKKSLKCLLGFHTASKYVIERKDGIDYFICRKCGKRYRII